MAESNRFRIPDSISESGDPVELNPFAAEDPRHSLWIEATRKAELFLSQAKLRAYGNLTPATARSWFTDLCLQKFHVWAWRGHWVVFTDVDIRAFDRWLVSYANTWIDAAAEHLANAPIPTEAILLSFRNDLGRHIEFWKVEARSNAEKYRELTANVAKPTPTPPVRPVVTEATKSWRRAQVVAHRRAHEWDAARFAREAGLSESAINGIIREDWKRFSEYKQSMLLAALGLSVAEWYRE